MNFTEMFITRRVNESKEYLENKFPGYTISYINTYEYDLNKNKVEKETFSVGNSKVEVIYVIDKKNKTIFFDSLK